ncbi:helix-turn-helix domain-containing protein [Brevibacillus reuszeri]|uniref:helix-turn-helix domain-containing protein n=1 Tax=Brevibacillus reuszeri TaxID=54915 RepID=UPI000CCC99BC|nr:helix-turn-helix transcriptional regulator [Brevibacillus reuszeri]
MNWESLGKKRTRLGKWLDDRGISQQWLMRTAGISKNTAGDLATKKEYLPSGSTMKKVLQALRKVDPNVKQHDFWSM